MAKRPTWRDLIGGGRGRPGLGALAVSAARRAMASAGSFGQRLAEAIGLASRSKRPDQRTSQAAMSVLEAAQAAGLNVEELLDRELQTSPGRGRGSEPPKSPPMAGEWPDEHDIELLPRAEAPRLEDEQVFRQPWITVRSSNVHSFNFQQTDRRNGILYVKFLNWTPGTKNRSGPGPMYAYYDVSVSKWNTFRNAATSKSAGEAVWDYLRVRGSRYAHQHQYTLQAGGTLASGETYVPRRVTRRGLRQRTLAAAGTGRRGGIRSQLPEMMINDGSPDRGEPNRGRPNRGR